MNKYIIKKQYIFVPNSKCASHHLVTNLPFEYTLPKALGTPRSIHNNNKENVPKIEEDKVHTKFYKCCAKKYLWLELGIL